MSSLPDSRFFRVALVCATLFAAVPGARAMDKTIVVLPLDTMQTEGHLSPAAKKAVEEGIRDEAIAALTGSGWTVLSGETTLQKLKDNGVDPNTCGEGGCHLETARNMTVPMFISGSIQFVEGTFTASFRLIDTKSGQMLGSASFESQKALGLRTEFRKLAPELFAKAGLATGGGNAGGSSQVATPSGSPPPAVSRPAAPVQGTLKVVSTPSGAKVSIDGDATGATPLSVKRVAGTYVVSIELPGYAPVSRQVDLAGGRTALVNETLMQAAGYIDVNVQPEAAARATSIAIDGQVAGVGKQGPYKIGKHAVRAEAGGFRAAEQSVSVDNGGTAPVQLVLEALPGKLLVSVNVAASCSAGSARVQATPDRVARLEVEAGRAQVTCAAEGYEDASADVEVGPGRAHAVKLSLRRLAVASVSSSGAAGGGRVEPKSGLEFVPLPGGALVGGNFPGTRVAPFAIGRTATTVAAYGKCVSAGSCTEPETGRACNWKTGRENHPINCVDWNQAVAFCRWIGGRLPTAEEREWAASGGEGRAYPWGSQSPSNQLCWDGEGSDLGNKGNRKTTCPVGAYPGGNSKQGLKDLAGNVWEWLSTDYDGGKELRGGSCFNDVASYCRTSGRGRYDPSLWDHDMGFRCAL